MAQIDDKILKTAELLFQDSDKIKMFKRFLDDIFMRFRGTYQQLHLFFDAINKIHPNIKFTISHTTMKNVIFVKVKVIQFHFLTHNAKFKIKKLLLICTESQQIEINIC